MTRDAIYNATLAVTRDATYDATLAVTRDATYDATRDATVRKWIYGLACHFAGKKNAEMLIQYCANWYGAYQGGNMWASFPAYAEGMRDVLKLTDLFCWGKYEAWEECAKEGSFRVIHEKFCIVSDFPAEIHVNAQNRPHCSTGPSHRWRDGFSIYHLNGVRVPEWLVMTSAERIDLQKALDEKNTDVQREIIRKIGPERMMKKLNAKTIDEADDPKTGYHYTLKEMKIGSNVNRKYLWFEHASMKGVFYAKPVPPETKKALHGRAWILSLVEQDELDKISSPREIKLYARFPESVS